MARCRAAMFVASVVSSTAIAASPALAAPTDPVLAGCAYKYVCVVDGGRIVYSAIGNAVQWSTEANDRADRIINNGSAYDLVVYEHASPTRDGSGWALCVPQGRVVDLASLRTPVPNQGSSHRWLPANQCQGTVRWLHTSAASGHALRMVDVARGQIGVREVPANSGTRVNQYQRSVRNDDEALDQAWCASFLTWASLQAGDPTPFRSAVVAAWVTAAGRRRFGMSVVALADVRVGDLVAFKHSGEWQHMGIVSAVGRTVQVISGNTSAAKGADGVFEKPLTNWTRLGYAVLVIRNAG